MSCCVRAAPALLLHVTLPLMMLSGAGLATAARLKWDPTTYVALRELFPAEYRAAAGALCALSLALLLLSHVAVCALALPPRAARWRRALLLTYAALMAALVAAEAAWLGWAGARVAAWLRGERAAQVAEVLEVRAHLAPLLQFLSRWHPVPGRVRDLLAEAEADAPRNLYVAYAALVLAAAAQPLAAVLALLAAARAPPRPHTQITPSTHSYSSTDNEQAPLKTAFRNGKLVVL